METLVCGKMSDGIDVERRNEDIMNFIKTFVVGEDEVEDIVVDEEQTVFVLTKEGEHLMFPNQIVQGED